MYYSGRRDDGPRPSPYELIKRGFSEFPGPVAVACDPPAGSTATSGGERSNGLPFAVHVTYRVPDGPKLLVRTKAVQPPPPEPGTLHGPMTIDTLQQAFGTYGRRSGLLGPPRGASPAEVDAWRDERRGAFSRDRAEYEALSRKAVSILIDGSPFAGFRVDYPDCSGLEVDWNGQTVQCVGTTDALDVLTLRSATEEDAEAIASSLPGRPRA